MKPFADLELLAPARDIEVGRAAIDHGADAVYIGGPGFGARANAGNSMSDIEALARYAHRYHARVYLTLNTLIFEHELEAAQRLAYQAYDAGVDALIVQDLGLTRMDLPPIEIHASTQCDVRTPKKAAFLDGLGFSQVVLARELTLEEIAACRAAMPRARIEFFVHGALCVSYSGRCYLSAAYTGRSANRGACSQPCRLPYDVFDNEGHPIAKHRHVLSLMDNDQSRNLEDLIAAGVSSFKIEGRLKGADYVKNLTAYYRKRLDQLLTRHANEGWQRASLGQCQFYFEPDPAKTFHRAATDYFVHGRQPVIAQMTTPKSTGQPVGQVQSIIPGPNAVFDLKTQAEIANGDGLVYTDSHDELCGMRVNRAEVVRPGLVRIFLHERIQAHPDLKPGTQLMRNKNAVFAKLMESKTSDRRVPVHLNLDWTPTALTILAKAGNQHVSIQYDQSLEASRNFEMAQNNLKKAFGKTGETIFDLASIEFLENGKPAQSLPFLPMAEANRLRRDLLTELETQLIEHHRRLTPNAKQLELMLPYVETLKRLDFTANVANSQTRQFWEQLGITEITDAFEVDHDNVDFSEAELMRCRHCIRHLLKMCPKHHLDDPETRANFKARNGGQMKATDWILVNQSNGKRTILRAHFDCKACEMVISEASPEMQNLIAQNAISR